MTSDNTMEVSVIDSDEARFLAEYDPRKFAPVAVTVDVVALTIRDGKLCTLLVTRENHPFKGKWALPGIFVQPRRHYAMPEGEERWVNLDTYAIDALREETNIERIHVEQLETFGSPGRDPRMHVISVSYLAFTPDLPDPTPGRRVTATEIVPVDEALDIAMGGKMAFDHRTILGVGIERAKAKLEYTTLATKFLPETFTIPELRNVYEVVWGYPLDAPNFHRKAVSTWGFIEPTREGPFRRDGARLWQASDAKDLFPPLKREKGDWS